MKRTWLPAAALLAASLAATGAVSAAGVYSSGSFSGTVAAWKISGDYEVTTQFTLSDKTNLSSAEVLLWVDAGQTPTALQWRIGTSAFGGNVATSASLTNTAETPNPANYDTYASSFAIGGVVDAGVTYWLTLSGATASGGSSVYWGDNGGSSAGKVSYKGDVLNPTTRAAFRLYGEVVDPPTPAVPEPASLTLLGLGAGCGFLVYRRRKGASA